MIINITQKQCREIMKCIDCCYSEGQGGDVCFLIKKIYQIYPEIKEDFDYIKPEFFE